MRQAPPGGPQGVSQALDALRRGQPVVVGKGKAALTVLSVELAEDGTLAALDAAAVADVLLTASRAEVLKLVNQRAAAAGPVRVARAPWLDLPVAVALADPVFDLRDPMKGPFATVEIADADAADGAIRLAKLAGLLPALFVRASVAADGALPQVMPEAIAAYQAPDALRIVTRARLPIAQSDQSVLVAFRGAPEQGEHLALLVGGDPARDPPPLVRLHSECLTGDVLGSLKCDCGPQLHTALDAMAAAGGGVLLYLRQEGRGIGLLNKLRAYALQDQGFDTVDANLRLGFGVDERDFGIAARMLALLNIGRIRLLSNNPHKVAGLQATGVDVVERVPLQLPANPHNAHYLATKRDRTGHIL